MFEARFPKRARLRRPPDYRKTFAQGRRLQDSCFIVVYRNRDEPKADSPRLGIATAKRNLRRAVDRNRIRRLVRESFRGCREQLPPVDIIVIAKPVSHITANRKLMQELEKHWQAVIKNSQQSGE